MNQQPSQPAAVPSKEHDERNDHAEHDREPRPTSPMHSGDDHATSHAEMIYQWSWRDWVIIILGFWLMFSPPTLGFAATNPRMMWSDLICGAAVVVMGFMVLFPRFDNVRWGISAVGLWLLFAPLVFWTTSPAAYNNDTLVGCLLIAFSVLIPMMPSKVHHKVMMGPGPDTPPGFSYNPSDWIQRGPIIAMAFVGFFLSRYLASYQLGHTDSVWDPFFGDGTRRVLESEVSKAWPISDAGLGTISYALEALSGFMGGRNRWRTMPWMVAMFGVLVVPLGVVSIVLIILQPIAVGAWCSICLITAVAMLIMISPAIDEVVAMGEFLVGAKREGKPMWHTFWVGGTLDSYPTQHQPRPKEQPGFVDGLKGAIGALDLNSVPWNVIVTAGIGVWLMAAPTVLGTTGRAADSNHLLGALIVTFAVIGFSEVARPSRLICVPLGLGIALAPWLVDGDTVVSRWNDVIAGLAVAALCLRRGQIQAKFGAWNKYLY